MVISGQKSTTWHSCVWLPCWHWKWQV